MTDFIAQRLAELKAAEAAYEEAEADYFAVHTNYTLVRQELLIGIDRGRPEPLRVITFDRRLKKDEVEPILDELKLRVNKTELDVLAARDALITQLKEESADA